jgi:zinc transport system substrate-binding protein
MTDLPARARHRRFGAATGARPGPAANPNPRANLRRTGAAPKAWPEPTIEPSARAGRRCLCAGVALALCLAVFPPAGAGAQFTARAGAANEAREALGVVVSIPPLHGLVAAVMAGVGSPHLLVRGGASPHDASLRPSDARALSAAKLVVWAGPGLEAFLVKPLRALAGAARVLTLTEAPEAVLLEQRAGGAFEPREARDAAAPPREGGRGPGAVNPHLWLDPRNAIEIARQAAAALAELDPDNAPRYATNEARLATRLEALDRELAARLGPVAEVPFAVLHDAYPYLEARYGLHAIGALTVNPAVPAGAKRLAALRARVVESGAVCVFAEPQFRPAVVAALVEGTGARAATLDPLGATLAPGPEAYFVLMRELADALVGCLGGG